MSLATFVDWHHVCQSVTTIKHYSSGSTTSIQRKDTAYGQVHSYSSIIHVHDAYQHIKSALPGTLNSSKNIIVAFSRPDLGLRIGSVSRIGWSLSVAWSWSCRIWRHISSISSQLVIMPNSIGQRRRSMLLFSRTSSPMKTVFTFSLPDGVDNWWCLPVSVGKTTWGATPPAKPALIVAVNMKWSMDIDFLIRAKNRNIPEPLSITIGLLRSLTIPDIGVNSLYRKRRHPTTVFTRSLAFST